MKRLIKFIFNLALAMVAVALTLGILFFVNPSWQKAAVEKALERDTARKWQLKTVSIQPNLIELEGVFMLEGEVGAEAELILLSGPFWQAPFTGVIEVESGSINGLEVDLSQVQVGDLTSADYQSFLKQLGGDKEFWKRRIGQLIGKFAASGFDLQVRNTEVSGRMLMPGNKIIPVSWTIVEAHSDAPRLTEIEPRTEKQLQL